MNVFVDTNVLVYARDTRDADKHARAGDWMDHLWGTRAGRISAQVLSEYYVTVTRKLEPGLSLADAHRDIADLTAWSPVPVDADLIAAAFAIEDDARLSYWDALIVAAAQRSGCDRLLSEDLNDGQAIAGVTVVSPFVHAPGG